MVRDARTEDLRLVRCDQVGALPRPLWLVERQAAFERGEIGAEALEDDHRRAVAGLVARQQDVGVPVLTDGEVSRRNFQESFGGAVTGFDALPYRYALGVHQPGVLGSTDAVPTIRAPSGMAENGPAVLHRRPVSDRLRLSRNVILEEYLRCSSFAAAPVKVTLIGPDRISQRFAHEASRSVYADIDAFLEDVVAIEREMIAAVVDAGCRYVQIDEPGYTAYVDEPSLELMRRRGEDPAQNLSRSIRADNALISGFPGVTFAVHICRGAGGGRGGSWFHRQGSYDAIAEQLYGELAFHRFLLEYDSEAAGGFESLRYMTGEKVAVLGLVSNHGAVETREYVEARLEQATRFVPVERTAVCPRCGFSGGSGDEAEVWGKLAVLREVSERVWGP